MSDDLELVRRDVLSDEPVADHPGDARGVVAYLLAPESSDYIAIMSALDSSPYDMTPADVCEAMRENDIHMDVKVAETRLEKLRSWGAAAGRSDHSHARRVQDFINRSFRYSATLHGRDTQRFYIGRLSNTTLSREIPLQSLKTVVNALEALARPDTSTADEWTSARINEIFIAHDDLDGLLVGSEETLIKLSDRFDLDTNNTVEFKSILVNYATRIAAELERNSARAAHALARLAPEFPRLAQLTVEQSAAADLIRRDLLSASKGGNVRDWQALAEWFDPLVGRSARFNSRMVLAIPTFHANLRRLHTAGESGTSRSRALTLARACLHEEIDDTAAREEVELKRVHRQVMHRKYLKEILAAKPGAILSDGAARVAYKTLCKAARRPVRDGRREADREGLACSLFRTETATGVLRAPSWSVWLPGREMVFHVPKTPAAVPAGVVDDSGDYIDVRISAGGAA